MPDFPCQPTEVILSLHSITYCITYSSAEPSANLGHQASFKQLTKMLNWAEPKTSLWTTDLFPGEPRAYHWRKESNFKTNKLVSLFIYHLTDTLQQFLTQGIMTKLNFWRWIYPKEPQHLCGANKEKEGLKANPAHLAKPLILEVSSFFFF